MAEKLLYVALDDTDRNANIELAEELAFSVEPDAGVDYGFKINLDGALFDGKPYIETIVGLGQRVFVDLKMNNGARTMTEAIRMLADLGVTHTNIWAQADSNLRKTMEKVDDLDERPEVLAVLFYTRWSDGYTREHYGMEVDDFISHWGRSAVANGVDGLIVPGNRLGAVADLAVPKLDPAIRMEEDRRDDDGQEQISDPFSAIVDGADMLVVGSPIRKASIPTIALRKYLDEMRSANDHLLSEGQ